MARTPQEQHASVRPFSSLVLDESDTQWPPIQAAVGGKGQ